MLIDITKLTPARAFVSQLSTATITLTASLLGLPLSTTHIVVGCIYGISIIDTKSVKDLQWRLILGIVLSWVSTTQNHEQYLLTIIHT
jgi:phosphate/sulfate permease